MSLIDHLNLVQFKNRLLHTIPRLLFHLERLSNPQKINSKVALTKPENTRAIWYRASGRAVLGDAAAAASAACAATLINLFFEWNTLSLGEKKNWRGGA